MAAKKSTDVMIAGKVYTLSGYEEEGYLQRVAAYINAKISEITEREEFRRIPNDMRAILIELNIADDYFKARTRFEDVEENYKKAEKDLFDLKHELVDTQMKVEELLEKLDSERKEKTNKNAREQALEEQYKKLEDKYQLLLSNAKIADEKNRQFEEILRLSQKENRELESLNKELRMNKEKLESALADALFGASQQTVDAKPPENEQAPIVVELSEEEKQAIAELAKISEPSALELSVSEESDEESVEESVEEAEDSREETEPAKAEEPQAPEQVNDMPKAADGESLEAPQAVSPKKEKNAPPKKPPVQTGARKKKDAKMLTLSEKKDAYGSESAEEFLKTPEAGAEKNADPGKNTDSEKNADADKPAVLSGLKAGDLIQFSREPDIDSIEISDRTGTEFSEEIQPVRTSFSKEEEPEGGSESSEKDGIPLTDVLTDSEEELDLQETDAVFAEISEDDDPELKEIAKQIAEMNRQEKAAKRKKKAK